MSLSRPAYTIHEKFKRYIELRTEVSIDEMMVRYTGRTQHTTKVKNKPIPQGYKVFALCCEGYLYDWIYWSTTAKMGDVAPVPGFCDTSSIVIRLAESLPYNRYPFIIFMDNFFSSVDLFARLRRMGIDACGTTRHTRRDVPAEFKRLKMLKLGEEGKGWGYIWSKGCRSRKPIDQNHGVHATAWLDNNWVFMLSTVHAPAYDGDSYIERSRRRPKYSSTNGRMVRWIFGDNARMDLPIPLIIDNYNFNMNGVDRADQLRASIECHRKGNRNWLPLLWWLLDSVKVNAYLLYKYQYKEKEGDFHPDLPKKMLTHRQFQEELALRLILDGYEQMKGHRRILERDAFNRVLTPKDRHSVLRHKLGPSRIRLPIERFQAELEHLPQKATRNFCLWCRYKCHVLKRTSLAEVSNNVVSISRTRGGSTRTICVACNVHLCKERCFWEFHLQE